MSAVIGLKCALYHASLSLSARKKAHEQFTYGEIQVRFNFSSSDNINDNNNNNNLYSHMITPWHTTQIQIKRKKKKSKKEEEKKHR